MSQYYVYILGNWRPTLYIGVTNDLVRRIYEHKNKTVEGFTKKYSLTKLLYFEVYSDIKGALEREKQLKHWNRSWKLELIRKVNPTFKDLYPPSQKTTGVNPWMNAAGWIPHVALAKWGNASADFARSI